ncbi:MAG: hypothetical protein K8L97_12185 [Anaerolineae bacterium]|nr:hypothetical protein [Anaerolineae bacterium]
MRAKNKTLTIKGCFARLGMIFTLSMLCIVLPLLGVLFLRGRVEWPIGIMGDCPEAGSYGEAKIQGEAHDANGMPIRGVEIQVQKLRGSCPQSVAENIQMISDTQGLFEGTVSVHLGDPSLSITVLSEEKALYEFDVGVSMNQFSVVTLDIFVADPMRVSWEVEKQ